MSAAARYEAALYMQHRHELVLWERATAALNQAVTVLTY